MLYPDIPKCSACGFDEGSGRIPCTDCDGSADLFYVYMVQGCQKCQGRGHIPCPRCYGIHMAKYKK